MRLSLCILLFGLFSGANAQVQFPKTPTKFMVEYKAHISKTASYHDLNALQNFINLWESDTLTPFHKKTTMQSIQILSDKRQSASTLLQVGEVLTLASKRKATEKQLDTLVQIFKHSFENNTPKEYQFLLNTLESYLTSNILFKDNVVTVTVEGDSWDLSLVGGIVDEYDGGYSFGTSDKKENDFDNFDSWDYDASEVEVDWDNVYEKADASFDANVEEEFTIFAEEMPSLDGGLLKLNNVNLIIQTTLDTIVLKQTSGTLSLTNGEFVGTGGKFDWTSVGLSEDVYAEFKDYHFSVKKPELLAEDVLMYNPEKVDGEISGIFEYQNARRKAGTISSYPRFMSYQNKIEIKGFDENIEYLGGFAMNGAKVFSSCVQKTPSTIKVKNEGELKFKVMAPYFELSDSILTGQPSKITLYFAEGDSITHPGVMFKYNNTTKELLTRKDNTKLKNAQYANSYHEIGMDVDQITWVLTDTVMNMKMVNAKQEVPAFFNSIGVYDESEYVRLKGLYPFHPIQLITNYCKQNRKSDFASYDLAQATKQNEKLILASLKDLQSKGFVDYNARVNLYSLSEKGKDYNLYRQGKKDYDIISVKSLAVTKPEDPSSEPIQSLPYNAQLNLNDNKLTVDGVDKLVLSDSNDVIVYPKDRKVIFEKNRGLIFNGKLTTNNYVFNGREFEFNYETFSLRLEHIDSIEFTIEVYDSITKTTKREKMDNKLSYSKGTLTIDEPNNKSGLKENARYPHFDANHGASVYFDKNDILNGAYDTTFRYQIPPFAVDSLSGDMESTVSFDGEFNSGDVFPPIKQKLEVMPDKSFGFNHEVPKEGYPIYNGLGKFYGTVSLNKNGLRGSGKIVFLNTTLESMDFVFFKDSVMGLGEIAITKEGTNPKTGPDVKFPAIKVTDYEMEWYPRKDSMHITNYDNAFKLFDDEVELSGALIITTKGVKGTGLVSTNGSLTISKNFLFKDRSFTATKAQFEILTAIVGKPALKSDYVNVEMDLNKKQAWFSPSEEGYASNNFPYLKYKTSLNDGFWDIQKKVVTMEKPYEMNIKDSYFYSTKKSQDSLVFNAEKAIYYIDSLKLKVEGVEVIKVADALIYPNGKKLEIKENAIMSNLKDAIVVMDTLNEYHTLINGDISINSRTDLDGHASYRYVNFQEDTIPIKFSDFKLEKFKNDKGMLELHTVARGTILEEDTFLIAPQMIFKGEVSMFAHRRLLSINGYIKLDLHGSIKSSNWMRYENNTDSDVIKIDLESQENKANLNLSTGTYFSQANQDYYSVFIGDKESNEDQVLIDAKGYLLHDMEKREFEVIEKNRSDNHYYSGNLFGYIEKEELYDLQGGFGLINSKPTTPHHYTFKFAGTGYNTIVDNALEVKGLGSLQFEIPSALTDQIGAKFLEMTKYYPPNKTLRFTDTLYHAIGDIVGHSEAIKYRESTSKEYFPLNKSLKYFSNGFTINDVNLVWDRDNKAWHSVGPIGLVNIGSQDFNIYVKGYLEIKKTEEEDKINFYLEATPNVWYYFSYAENALSILSSDSDLETYIRTKNTAAKNMSRGLYYWNLGEEDDVRRFKQNFVETYLNGQDFEINLAIMSQNNYNQEDEFKRETKEEVKDDFEEEFNEETPKTDPVDEFETPQPKKKEEVTPKEQVTDDEFETKPEVTQETDEFGSEKSAIPVKEEKKAKPKKEKKSKAEKTIPTEVIDNKENTDTTIKTDEFEEAVGE